MVKASTSLLGMFKDKIATYSYSCECKESVFLAFYQVRYDGIGTYGLYAARLMHNVGDLDEAYFYNDATEADRVADGLLRCLLGRIPCGVPPKIEWNAL